MAALRFAVAALPALVMPRPPIPLHRLVFVGTAWFVAQFGLLYLGMHLGMPPGLASVLMQAQAFFTIIFAAVALGERPSSRQIVGLRSEEHTSELQSRQYLVCRLLLEKKKTARPSR